MKKCPKCMKTTDGKFCPDCGYDMSLVDALICPTCGAESKSVFCPNCGTKLQETVDEIEPKDKVEPKEEQEITVEAIVTDGTHSPIDDSEILSNNSNNSVTIDSVSTQSETHVGDKPSSTGSKNIVETVKNKPAIIGVAVAVILLLLLVGLGGKSSDTTSDTSDSYSTSSDTSSDSTSTSSDSSNGSDYNYGSANDGMSYIQGTWKIVGVVNDGETTDASGYSFGTLVISGDKWDMTINTTETTENYGTLYFDSSEQLDDGTYFYIYTMKSGESSGSVKMAYSEKDDYIAVSTSSYLDSDNCIFFHK